MRACHHGTQEALQPASLEGLVSGLAGMVSRELLKTSASVHPAPPPTTPTAHQQHHSVADSPVATAAVGSFSADKGSVTGCAGSQQLGRIFSGKVLQTNSFRSHSVAEEVRWQTLKSLLECKRYLQSLTVPFKGKPNVQEARFEGGVGMP